MYTSLSYLKSRRKRAYPATLPVPLSVTKAVGMATDALLVRRAIEGDERALRGLWSQYAPRVDAVIRRLVGDPDDAADVAQEVWIQIFRALPGFRGDAQFGTWIHRIAVNRTLNALRRSRRVHLVETPIEEHSATALPDDEMPFVRATIREAAARLAPGARAVFVLHDIEGYTHEEIAAALGITAGGSKSQLFKARVRMRKMLAHLAGPGDGAALARRSADHDAVADASGRPKSDLRKLEVGGRPAQQAGALRSWKGGSQ